MDVRFGWETHPNPSRATLHCDYELPTAGTFICSADSADAQELEEAILAIHGVCEMSSRNYALRVKRGGVFSWEEIMPRVEDVVAKFIGASGVKRVEAASGI